MHSHKVESKRAASAACRCQSGENVMRHTSLLIATVVVSAASLSACVVAPAYPAQDAYYGGPVVVANAPPPAPYVETVPVVPYAGAVWIGGYWGFSGGHHQWVAGHYEHARPGYTWQPHRWEQRGNHWELHGGGWVR
jgi:hypothetical protein